MTPTRDTHDYWLWLAAAMLAIALLFVGMAVTYATVQKSFPFWTSSQMLVAYLFTLLTCVTFVTALRTAPGDPVTSLQFVSGGLQAASLTDSRNHSEDKLRLLLADATARYADELRARLPDDAARFELDLNAEPGELASGSDDYLTRRRDSHPLPAGTTIREVFRESGDIIGGRLLILGAPGAGKTTMLLELAQALIAETGDPPSIVPVWLPLRNWRSPQSSRKSLFHRLIWRDTRSGQIGDYAVLQISKLYGVSRGSASRWLEERRLLLMLDGLDEIRERRERHACVIALNEFMRDHSIPVVVGSRTDEYERLDVKLEARRAVGVRPLSDDELLGAVSAAGSALAGVRSALAQDPELLDLCRRPLFLRLVLQAYEGREASEIQKGQQVEERRAEILEDYVIRCLEGNDGSPHLRRRRSASKHREWLVRLASGMDRSDRSVVMLEDLQPAWLPRMYRAMPVAVIPFLVLLVIEHRGVGTLAVLAYGLLLGSLQGGYTFPQRVTWAWRTMIRPETWILSALFGGVVGLVIGFERAAMVSHVTIWPVGLTVSSPVGGLLVGSVTGAVVISVASGLKPSAIDANVSVYGGVRRSLAVGATLSVLAAVATFCIYLAVVKVAGVANRVLPPLPVYLTGRPKVDAAIDTALGVSLCLAMVTGIGAVIAHLWVRLGLAVTRNGPVRYVAWLEDMVRARVLVRSGGAYSFVHGLLQEHLSTEPKLDDGEPHPDPSSGADSRDDLAPLQPAAG